MPFLFWCKNERFIYFLLQSRPVSFLHVVSLNTNALPLHLHNSCADLCRYLHIALVVTCTSSVQFIYIFFYNMQVYTCTIHPMHFKQTQTCTLSFLCSLSLSCRRLMIPLHQSIFWPPVALQAWPSVSSLFMDERKMVPLGPRCTEVCKKVIEHIYSLRNIPPPRRRFYRKIFAKQANYLPAILLLKMNMPPSVCTNLCLCVRTCMPMYMSWRECVYYLSMRLL